MSEPVNLIRDVVVEIVPRDNKRELVLRQYGELPAIGDCPVPVKGEPDTLLTCDVEEVIVPISVFHDQLKPDQYKYLADKTPEYRRTYIAWTPRIEEFIGIRINVLIRDNAAMSDWIRELTDRIYRWENGCKNASFWTRLKYLFSRRHKRMKLLRGY